MTTTTGRAGQGKVSKYLGTLSHTTASNIHINDDDISVNARDFSDDEFVYEQKESFIHAAFVIIPRDTSGPWPQTESTVPNI